MTSIARSVTVRPALPADVPALAGLMRDYMRETYDDDWHGSAEALLRDGFGGEFEIQVAATKAGLIGLLAWRKAYDFHHCMRGAEVIDMYVVRAFRGRSVGPLMVVAVADQVLRSGGRFVRGQAVENPAVRRLYGRVAVGQATVECTLSGRALRAVAKLAHGSPRQIARALPPRSWNYEA